MSKKQPGPRRIDAEFKREVVRMVLDQGMSVQETCAAMGIGATAIRRWIKLYRAGDALPVPEPAQTPEQIRIKALEAELRQMREDNDILKKASAFFARNLR